MSSYIHEARAPMKLKQLLHRLPPVGHVVGNHSAHIRDSREPSPLNRVHKLGNASLAYANERQRPVGSQDKSRLGHKHKIDSYIVFDGSDRQPRNEMYIVQNRPEEMYPDYKKSEKLTMLSPAKGEQSVDNSTSTRHNDYSSYLLPRDDEVSLRVKKLGNIFQPKPLEDPRTLLRRDNRSNADYADLSPVSVGPSMKVVLPLPHLAHQYRLPKISSLDRGKEDSLLPRVAPKPPAVPIIRRPEYYTRLPNLAPAGQT